jgi:hypothetical protein
MFDLFSYHFWRKMKKRKRENLSLPIESDTNTRILSWLRQGVSPSRIPQLLLHDIFSKRSKVSLMTKELPGERAKAGADIKKSHLMTHLVLLELSHTAPNLYASIIKEQIVTVDHFAFSKVSTYCCMSQDHKSAFLQACDRVVATLLPSRMQTIRETSITKWKETSQMNVFTFFLALLCNEGDSGVIRLLSKASSQARSRGKETHPWRWRAGSVRLIDGKEKLDFVLKVSQTEKDGEVEARFVTRSVTRSFDCSCSTTNLEWKLKVPTMSSPFLSFLTERVFVSQKSPYFTHEWLDSYNYVATVANCVCSVLPSDLAHVTFLYVYGVV